MNSTTVFLLTLAAMTGTPSDLWDRRPTEILITSAHLWRVNSAIPDPVMGQKAAEDGTARTGSLSYFQNANISTNKVNTAMKFLVLDQSKVNTRERAFIQFDFDKEGETFAIDTGKVVQKLRDMHVWLPEGDLFFLPGKSTKEVFRRQEVPVNQWYLLPKSFLEEELRRQREAAPDDQAQQQKQLLNPVQQFAAAADGQLVLNNQAVQIDKINEPILSSTLIEWGDKDKVKQIYDELMAADQNEEHSMLAARVYNKHYIKLPLEMEVFSSNLGDTNDAEANEEGVLDEIFIIRHRLRDEGTAYLWVKKDLEGKPRLFLMEVPHFRFDGNTYSFQIPARCFIDTVVTKKLRAPDLQCLLPKNSATFETRNACRSVSLGNGKEENEGGSQLRIVGSLPADFDAETDTPTTFWLKANDDLDSYEIHLRPGQDLPVEIPPDTDVFILDANTCQPRPLFKPPAQKQ